MAGNADCFGRDAELAAVEEFLDAIGRGPRAFVIEGDPEIGKTTVWSAGVAAASARSYRVLAARPIEEESDLPYCAVGDLVDGIEDVLHDTLALLPTPQRRALEVVLLLDENGDRKPGKRAVAVATLGLLRLLTVREPVLIAVDDAHWLDGASARVLSFAVRRLRSEPVGLLVTVEKGRGIDDPLGVVRAFGESGAARTRLGPLDGDALRLLLRSRAGPEVARATLLEVERLSDGNAAIALELAAAGPDVAAPGEPLPVPERLRQLERGGIDALSQAVVDVLLVVAALANPSVEVVEAAVGPQALERLRTAAAAGLVTLDGDAVAFAHPLTASVVYLDATAAHRRRLHRQLAEVVPEAHERARHLALATEGPDAEVAAEVDAAAAAARRSGIPATAADLMELAHSLTPPEFDDDKARRALAAAADHDDAGNAERARRLLEETLGIVGSGPARVEALAHLCRIRAEHDDLEAAIELGDAALREPDASPAQQAEVSTDLATAALLHGDPARARTYAGAAVDDAEELGLDVLLAELLGVLALADVLTGQDVWPSLLDLGLHLDQAAPSLNRARGAGLARAQLSFWEGDLPAARQRLLDLRRRAVEAGNEASLPPVLCVLAQVECQAGDWARAAAVADDAYRLSVLAAREPERALALSARALVATHIGEVDSCRTLADSGLALADSSGCRVAARELRSTLGLLELSLGNHAGARRQLRAVTDETARAGITEPGVLRFVPDAVEAAVATGQPETAAALLAPFEERSRTLHRPGAVGAAARSRALVSAARGDFDAALSAFEDSYDVLHGAGLPFEVARTLLAQGRVQRRVRQWGPARESLGRAVVAFDTLGARLWAESARDDLARVGGRASSTGAELTASERRVADLVGQGLKNREVAEALFMSLKTVEATLTRVYRKLGVHSRAELRAALSR